MTTSMQHQPIHKLKTATVSMRYDWPSVAAAYEMNWFSRSDPQRRKGRGG